ncbi:MORC CW-type zinc finger [Mactra antiquata]
MASDAGIKSSRVSPKFLHGNSTSHTWPFSAIAEIIDNAYDPDVSASEIWIDKRKISKLDCLTFVDNGNGMTYEKLFKMLSFGFCEKVEIGNVKPIGYFGNGFKSGSMRLGLDALVFTRSLTSTSIGFLSQSYLKAINAEAVVVPIVTWNLNEGYMSKKEGINFDDNMDAILKYSLFKTMKDLIAELKSLERMKTGTNIIIYNLQRDETGKLELDFSSDSQDIRNSETPVIDLTTINRPIYSKSPEYRRSLREYCSILYLKPRMKIVLRGVKVKSKLISKSLSQTEKDVYKPTWLEKPIQLTFGFSDNKEPDSYGLMMYHKNRLILAYEKIGCQKQANNHGVGVIGVVEANFLQPIHNKQAFNQTSQYVAFMQNAATKLNDYFYEKIKNTNPDAESPTSQTNLPDWTWAQCDNCLSWRRLPTGYKEKLPDKWFCYLNPDAAFNRCDIPEEPEDDDEALQPTYKKTYKKSLAEKNKQAKLIEARKLKEKEEALKKKEAQLQSKMREISRKSEVLEEVSSSQDRVDRKPTVADLDRAKKSLQVYQQKMLAQEQTIKQLENQKKKIEENSKAMLNMAESLRLTNLSSKTLMDKVEGMTGTSSSKVTSTTLRAPTKRKSTTNDGSNEKVTRIKTEDGGFITVSFSEDSVVDLTLDEDTLDDTTSSVEKDKPKEPEKDSSNKSTDKTVSEESEMTDTVAMDTSDQNTSIDNDNTSLEVDKSKRKSNLSAASKKQKVSDNNDKNAANTDKDKSDVSSKQETKTVEKDKVGEGNDVYTELTAEDVKPDVKDLDTTLDKKETEIKNEEKVLVQKSVQTVPTVIKFASPEEVDLLKLCPLEQSQILLQKSRELQEIKNQLTETKSSLKSLQGNIWQLLKIIVADFDYGDPENIEKVILDFIRVNGEQNDQPSTSGQ